ncbi:MAG: TatD family hydrolase [Endomicrobiales bacterium]
MALTYIDTHAHLSDKRFDGDRPEALGRARDAGVTRIIEVGCEEKDWERTLALCDGNPGVYCILGIHPQEAKAVSPETFRKLETLAKSSAKVVGIGETGLDYHYEYSPRDVQKQAFLRHAGLAGELNKPLVIHCRNAYPDLIELLRTMPEGLLRGVVHCFSGNPEEAQELTRRGFLIGIDGPLSYPNAAKLRRVVEQLPLEAMLLETDSPYLAPQAHRGTRNEPSYVPLIAQEIARVKGISLGTVAETTTARAERLFGISLKDATP